MFIRVKTNGPHEYLQLVTSERIDGKVRQRVIGTLAVLHSSPCTPSQPPVDSKPAKGQYGEPPRKMRN